MDCCTKNDCSAPEDDGSRVSNLKKGHYQELRGSALSEFMIRLSGIYTERDPYLLAKTLNWKTPARGLGDGLVFPFVDWRTGEFSGFSRVKFDNPRVEIRKDKSRRLIKYEQPAGEGSRIYTTKRDASAIRDSRSLLAIFEGEKKSLAASQLGFAAIGLTGIWNGFKPRKNPRELIDELAAIDWSGRPVLIYFDFDSYRNPDVNYAQAELARVLTERGAIVTIIEALPGPRDEHGNYRKMGFDDYLLTFGEESLRQHIAEQLKPRDLRALDDFRQELSTTRIESLGKHNLYFDGSPTGAGKTTADMAAIEKSVTSLTILPTHKNGKEVEAAYRNHPLDAAKFPQINGKTCLNLPIAQRAIESGLSASQAVCPTCSRQLECDYRDFLKEAEDAAHQIATHHRAALSFEQLAKDRDYIAIHEDATNVLRPSIEIARGLEQVAKVADEAITFAQRRQYGQDCDRSDEHFLHRMVKISDDLIEALEINNATKVLDLPAATPSPFGTDARLHEAMLQLNVWPASEPMQLVKLLAAGKVAELVVRVDEVYQPGSTKLICKSIVGIRQTLFPKKSTVWIADATASHADVELMAGRTVINATPNGRLEQKHPIMQFPIDVTKQTRKSKLVAILEAVISVLPYQRFGIIAHREHVTTINRTALSGEMISESCRSRIARIEHFRSGSSRGSNEWLNECDCILIAGTPRVPSRAIKNRLMALGLLAAATRSESDAKWRPNDYWSGVTVQGTRMSIKTGHFCDHDWHRAYLASVRAELLQSIGRGRAVCENGIPTVVISTENLGFPLIDLGDLVETESDKAIEGTVNRLSLVAL
jgi:hypothetical protein